MHSHDMKDIHLSTPILQTEALAIGYKDKKSTFILEEKLDITIRNGELVCLIGPNGSGKSTLMRTIAGLQKPIHGASFISGVNLKKLSPHKCAKLLSLVLTDKIEAGSMTVEEIVAIGRYPYINYFARLQPEDEQIIADSLKKVHLESYANRCFSELSDGEKQRVMIAKALAQDTPLIMLDEPTAHLDLPNRVEIMNLLKQLAKEVNKAILLSTHELDLALQTADTIWLMHREGKLIKGTPEDLVINGTFEHVFQGNAFNFDKYTGSFKVKHPSKGEISLTGEHGIPFLWTKRALERDGYSVKNHPNGDIHVQVVNDTRWKVSLFNHSVECETVAGLLKTLRHQEWYKQQCDIKKDRVKHETCTV